MSDMSEPVSVHGETGHGAGHMSGNRRVWTWGKHVLLFAVCVSVVSLLSGVGPGLVICGILLGCIVAPLQILVIVNLAWMRHCALNAGNNSGFVQLGRVAGFYAAFGVASGLALLISSKFIPVAVQTRLSRWSLPLLTAGSGLVDAVVPAWVQAKLGAPFTLVSELILMPVFVTLLHATAQLKYAGECFDRERSPWAVGSYELFASPSAASNTPAAAGASKRKQVVIVLIHGNRSNEAQWLSGKFLMRSRPWASDVAFLSINYFSGKAMRDHTEATATIQGCAEIACAQLEAKLKDRGLEPQEIILMGHSLGGLVSCYISEFLAEQRALPVSHVVSWSAPLGGSALFLWAQRNLPERFVPEKKLIRAEFCPTAASTRAMRDSMRQSGKSYFCVSGRCDHLVRPDSACPDFLPADRKVVLPYLGHFNIKVSLQAWRVVIEHLERGGHVPCDRPSVSLPAK